MGRIVKLTLLLALASSWSGLGAHEGHAHKVMGTVAAVDAKRIEVDATDGTKVSLLLTAETKYRKGKAPAAAEDVEVGQRVVVTYVEEGGKKRATEVRLGRAEKPASPTPKPSPRDGGA